MCSLPGVLDGYQRLCYNNKNIQKGLLLRQIQRFMTPDKIKKIHRYYSIALAILLIVVGVLFILSCMDIYAGGPRSYSAEAIAQRFQKICIPVYLLIAGIVGAAALNLCLPQEKQRPRSLQNPRDQMLLLQKKTGCPSVSKEVRLRRIAVSATALLFIGLMVYPLIYFMTPEHFTVSNLNNDIVKAVLISMLPAAAGLILCWLCQLILNGSYRRETSVFKQALASGQKAAAQSVSDEDPTARRWILRGVLLGAALLLILLGIQNGGAEDVLKKAIAICTECIGLG